jgi:hypothetical protein
VTPRLRPGFSIKIVMMRFFASTRWIALDAVPKGQKHAQDYFVHNIIPSLHLEKKRFARWNTSINSSVEKDDSMCHNGHRVMHELHCLRIIRASHPPYSPDIDSRGFWIFGDLKESERNGTWKGLTKFWSPSNNDGTMSLLRIFKWYLNHGVIACVGSLSTGENAVLDEIFTFPFSHSWGKIGWFRKHGIISLSKTSKMSSSRGWSD